MARIVRVWIDPDVCLTDGFCVDECPAVFNFDDETTARPQIVPDVDGLYAAHDATIREAVNTCPYAAIHIVESDD